MPEVPVNYLAVLVAGVASMVIGFLWYGPVFGKQWLALSGVNFNAVDPAKRKAMANRGYVINFIASLVMAFVLAHTIAYTQAASIMDAAFAAFWTWLGFIATVLIGMVLWENKPVKLYLINAFHYLAVLIVMAIIIFWMA